MSVFLWNASNKNRFSGFLSQGNNFIDQNTVFEYKGASCWPVEAPHMPKNCLKWVHIAQESDFYGTNPMKIQFLGFSCVKNIIV